ncbi:MAG: 23S rRNA (pseudouridine(1915)-N(3))-methyltransferase RlmH [Rikenellaceae bacterium]|jgi:23S rRNA (pseudouridine1915-N3)-methyltransferase|nr:23S rRNA (pseudouridine(1915)-N(3))-methyltransferase RlmH [Rikenellaceae bacterium]
MNIDLVAVGKTDSPAIADIVSTYAKRISHYARFSVVLLPDVKNTGKMAASTQCRAEGEMLLKQFAPEDYVVLLDDKGAAFTSMEFAAWLGRRLGSGVRRVCFVVGGPYGFSKEVYARGNDRVSLSPMTFSHQIVRAIFAEQLYRAFSILNNLPYHHE